MIRNINTERMEPIEMDGCEGASMAVMVGRRDGAPHFAVRSIEVQPGGHTPRHRHDYEHEVFVVSGSGMVLLGDRVEPIKAGDVIYVEANLEHQFRSTDESLRFLCMVPVEQNCGGDTPGS